MWTMLALEATLRGCLDAQERTRLQQLIDGAHEEGLIDDEGASILHEVRALRNKIGHQAVTFDVPPQAIIEWIGGLHAAISDIYTRAANRRA